MSHDRNRIKMRIMMITWGLLGLAVSMVSFALWSYSLRPMGPMMGRWKYGKLEEVSGTLEKTVRMEIELKVDGKEVEVHGPYWFWQRIGIKEGNAVTVKGVLVSMMEPGEGCHEGLIPFELKVNGETYGNASRGIPIWMQE